MAFIHPALSSFVFVNMVYVLLSDTTWNAFLSFAGLSRLFVCIIDRVGKKNYKITKWRRISSVSAKFRIQVMFRGTCWRLEVKKKKKVFLIKNATHHSFVCELREGFQGSMGVDQYV